MNLQFTPNKEGIFLDVPAETYHAAPGFSHSMSKRMLPPARLKATMDDDDERETTAAMIMGTLTHALLLEPEKPLPQLAIKPEGMSFAKTEGKVWRDKANAEKKIIIKEEDYEAVLGMVRSIARNELCKKIFAAGESEVSIFDRQPVELSPGVIQDVLCKNRLDFLPYGNALVDIKTVLDGGSMPDKWQKIQTDSRYFTQGTWYLTRWNSMIEKWQSQAEGVSWPEIDHNLMKRRESFVFIVVEKVKPYLVNFFQVDDETHALGCRQNTRDIASYARCINTNSWPGHADAIHKVGITEWEKKRLNALEFSAWEAGVKLANAAR